MKQLLIASSNPGKLREIRAILDAMAMDVHVKQCLELILPAELGLQLEVVEDGATYAENAVLKARAYCSASGLATLADDSGLEVAALGGAPGLYSARYAPWQGATDADRRKYLLQNLHGSPQPWDARFRCAIAIALPDGTLHQSEGACEGLITAQERGSRGFGYDPIFLLQDRDLTMAELSETEKNRISHRARAVRAALPFLQSLCE